MLGIDAFEGIAKATVTLALDASATVAVNGSAHLPGKGSDSGFELADGACVDVSTALNVNAAADAGLFDIFSKGASVNLFSKTFDLFNVRCSVSPSTSLGGSLTFLVMYM